MTLEKTERMETRQAADISLSCTQWREILNMLPLGTAIIDPVSGQTIWLNRALQALLADSLATRDVIGRYPTEYLPGLDENAWKEASDLALRSTSDSALTRYRVQLVHHSTRNIAYWDWAVQTTEEAERPLLLLTVEPVTDVVMNERVLATAGRNADRARKRAEALVRLTQLVNASLTTTELLKAVTHEAASYFTSDSVAILLLNPNNQRFEIGYSIGLQPLSTTLSRSLRTGQKLSNQGIAGGRTLVVIDPEGQNIQTPLLEDGRLPAVLITSPIIQNERVYGALEIYFDEVREVSDDAQTLLSAFADQTAIALLKADLYEQIESQRRQLQSIFDNAPVGIVHFDRNGKAVVANIAAAVHFNHPLEEMLNRHYSHFLPVTTPDLFENVLAGTPFHANHIVQRLPDDTEKVSDISLLPMRNNDGEVIGLLLLSFDVTELVTARKEADSARKVAEDALLEVRATQSQMVQMEKMRAVGELASGVAHDFNNALMAILGYAELAEEDLTDVDSLGSYLAIIKKAAMDASSTVQRLQRFARQNSVTHGEPTDLNSIVQDVVELTRPRWRDAAQKEGRTYVIQTSLGEVPAIVAEPSGLREVLINMVHNALNAMPQGGRLTLSTRLIGNDEVEIEVADTGIGMTPEVSARIFDPFFTTRGVEGTGLGLAVSWTIIRRHGGSIEVTSAPNEGTRFSIRLPIQQQHTQSPITPTLLKPTVESGIPVLVVDDEPVVASVIANILSRQGMIVDIAYSASAALERFRQHPDKYRLVLTDHGMPGMNGLELVTQIKKIREELPVLLLTGWGDTVLQNYVAETLPDAVLGKPINQSDLLQEIAKALQARTFP